MDETRAPDAAGNEDATRFGFAFACSYMGCTTYRVHGDGETYEVTVRNGLPDHERRIWNGDGASWLTEVAPTLDSIIRRNRPDLGIDDRVVNAFNAWRLADHTGRLATLEADPYRYGVIGTDDPFRTKPAVVRGLRLGGTNDGPGRWTMTRNRPDIAADAPSGVRRE